MLNTIDRTTLHRKLNSAHPPVLLEALPQRYFDDKHLPGAKQFPHDQIDAAAARLLPDKGAEIVVYCANAQCRNSHVAAQRLLQLGYASISVYGGGKQDWEEGGLPFESNVTETA
jgi:rhodanese-related sulfurtransferase